MLCHTLMTAICMQLLHIQQVHPLRLAHNVMHSSRFDIWELKTGEFVTKKHLHSFTMGMVLENWLLRSPHKASQLLRSPHKASIVATIYLIGYLRPGTKHHVSMGQQVCWQPDTFTKKYINSFRNMISWCNCGYGNLQGLLALYYTPGRRNLLCIITNVWTLREGLRRFWLHHRNCCRALTLSYKPKWWRYECFCLPCLLQQSSTVRELTGVS